MLLYLRFRSIYYLLLMHCVCELRLKIEDGSVHKMPQYTAITYTHIHLYACDDVKHFNCFHNVHTANSFHNLHVLFVRICVAEAYRIDVMNWRISNIFSIQPEHRTDKLPAWFERITHQYPSLWIECESHLNHTTQNTTSHLQSTKLGLNSHCKWRLVCVNQFKLPSCVWCAIVFIQETKNKNWRKA